MPDWFGRVVVGLLLVTVACTSEDPAPEVETGEWGPLAVFESDPEGVSAGGISGPGTLTISDRCVLFSLQEGGEVDLLVWGSGRTSWDAQEQEIVFQDPLDGEIRLEDGDVFVAGGGHIDFDELDSNADWLAEPHSSCPTESVFVVGGVEVVED